MALPEGKAICRLYIKKCANRQRHLARQWSQLQETRRDLSFRMVYESEHMLD